MKNYQALYYKNYFAQNSDGDYIPVNRKDCFALGETPTPDNPFRQRWFYDPEAGYAVRLERNQCGEDTYLMNSASLKKGERQRVKRNEMIELRPVLEQAEAQTQGIDKFLRMVKRFTEIKELSAEVVSEFIERIEVGETVMVNPRRFPHWADEKRQNIKIVYNYIGAVPQEGEPITASASGKIAYKG